MNDESVIAIGDKIDLVARGGETYRTIVGDITEDGSLLVVIPSRRGAPVTPRLGDGFRLFFYRQSGRYGMDVKTGGFMMSNAVRLVRFLPMSGTRKEQRRENYRLPASLKTLVCQYTEDVELRMAEEETHEIAYTNDISISGVSLRTRQNYSLGEKLLLKVYLNWPDEDAPPLDIYSEIRRINPVPENGSYQVGFLFLRLLSEAGEVINKFVLEQQQKRIRQQRLIDED